MRTLHLSLCTALVVVLTGSSAIRADESAEDIIKYREGVMKSMGGHVVAAAQIVQRRVSPPGHLKVHAAAIAGVTDDITQFFPPGSYEEDGHAKPEIWERWDEFEAAADDNRRAAREFLKLVEEGADGSAIAAGFKQLGESCKGCHEDFRRKDE